MQTDKDVLRFAQALIAAYGRNDTQATLDALQRYQEAINKAKTKTEARIDARRKAQGVETYFGGTRAEQPTQQAPTTQPRATKRWNPETKQLEPI